MRYLTQEAELGFSTLTQGENLMQMKRFAAAAAFLAAFAAPAQAPAQQAENSRPDVIGVRVCNESRDHVRVAISYQPVGQRQFYNEGWYGVAPHSCETLALTGNAFFYAYAEVANDGERFWGGNHRLCVMYPGPYQFYSTASGECVSGQEPRNFAVLRANGWGVYTWTLGG